MTTIDGDVIRGATIDGEPVSEITLDGQDVLPEYTLSGGGFDTYAVGLNTTLGENIDTFTDAADQVGSTAVTNHFSAIASSGNTSTQTWVYDLTGSQIASYGPSNLIAGSSEYFQHGFQSTLTVREVPSMSILWQDSTYGEPNIHDISDQISVSSGGDFVKYRSIPSGNQEYQDSIGDVENVACSGLNAAVSQNDGTLTVYSIDLSQSNPPTEIYSDLQKDASTSLDMNGTYAVASDAGFPKTTVVNYQTDTEVGELGFAGDVAVGDEVFAITTDAADIEIYSLSDLSFIRSYAGGPNRTRSVDIA